jgi:hypothetical protein
MALDGGGRRLEEGQKDRKPSGVYLTPASSKDRRERRATKGFTRSSALSFAVAFDFLAAYVRFF